MEKKKHNFSLFIYTGLIFLLAVILILITFFGQSRLEKNQPEVDIQTETNTLTQRAAVLSEENNVLLEENRKLTDQVAAQSGTINALNEQITSMQQSERSTELLLSANGYVSKKLYREARAMLEEIDVQSLTEDETILYNTLVKRLR